MADSSRTIVEKLNNSNYQVWKYKLQLLMIKDDLWDVIVEPKPEPPTAQWLKCDGKARATIGLLVEDSQLQHIKTLNTAKEVWESLRKYHEKASLTNKVFMLKRLCSMRLDDSGNMENHLQVMFETVDKLVAFGEALPDHLLVAFMLCSLPDSYSTLVTALETRPEADLTSEMVKEKLINEYKRRNESAGTNVNSALKATNVKESRQAAKICFYCQKPGHFKQQCRKMHADRKKAELRDKHKANTVSQVSSDAGNSSASNRQTEKYDSQYCFGTSNEIYHNKWHVDSGATCHMSNQKDRFINLDPTIRDSIYLANGSHLEAKGAGIVMLNCIDNYNKVTKIKVERVLYVPELQTSLLSVHQLMDKGFTVTFKGKECNISIDSNIVATAYTKGKLYELNCTQSVLNVTSDCVGTSCIHVWHRRMGHRNPDDIKRLASKGHVKGLDLINCNQLFTCENCIKMKMTRQPFPQKSSHRASNVIDLVHTDICGPMRTITPGGKKYFLTLIDDYSRFTMVYFLSTKNEAAKVLKDYTELMLTQFNRKPKVIRSDGGGEYTGRELQDFCISNGMKRQITAPYSPEQNGVSERKNRTLCEMARCMLDDAKLDDRYWAEAIHTANYLQNRMSTKACFVTPYELWYGEKPDVSHFRIFGTTAYAHIPNQKTDKLSDRSRKYTFVGYSDNTKGYRLLDTLTNKICISRDVKFIENGQVAVQHTVQVPTDMDYTELSSTINNIELMEDTFGSRNAEDQCQPFSSDIEEDAVILRRSQRSNIGEKPKRYALATAHESEPKTRCEALENEFAEEWKCAMDEEIASLKENDTWTLVTLPQGKKPIGCKWVYKIKHDANGKTSRFKARLVAQGFSQIPGLDYDDVYAPVIKNTTFRLILTIAGKEGMVARHFDIRSAFLNGTLDENIYMCQPEGYVKTGEEKLFCHLNKSIYGLKQSAKSWNTRLHQVLSTDDFKESKSDPCLYIKNKDNILTYILVYVDDLIVVSKCNDSIENVYKLLAQEFKTSDLGNLNYYLGIQIKQDNNGVFHLNQETYINKLLSDFKMQDSRPSNIPMDPGYLKTSNVNDTLPNNDRYRRAIGALLYIAINTRPDISASVSILSRKITAPTVADWCEVKRLLRYLKGTKSLSLRLGNSLFSYGTDLVGFADADWAGDICDRRSNSGYIFTYHGASISWGCRKQSCVSLSSTEAEYVALCESAKEAKWLRDLLGDLNLGPHTPTDIYEDNQSCVKLIDNEKISQRTKHIDIRYHFVRDLKDKNLIKILYCPTDNMIADALTKPLQRIKLVKLRTFMGLI